MTLFVARDKATWDAVKKAVADPQMLPRGFAKGGGPDRLNTVDFQKDMIVAVVWGQMSFSGQGEKCWIESVTAGKDEVTVDCRASLWGGAVKHAYLAWPYHAKTVKRSDLPVTFIQTCETGWSINVDPNNGQRMACFMIYGSSSFTLDGGKTWRSVGAGPCDHAAVD